MTPDDYARIITALERQIEEFRGLTEAYREEVLRLRAGIERILSAVQKELP